MYRILQSMTKLRVGEADGVPALKRAKMKKYIKIKNKENRNWARKNI